MPVTLTGTADYYRPTSFEVASSWVHGILDPAPATPEQRAGETPRQALHDLLVPALAAPPCFVAFSGGRDSSAVLAAATQVARSEGLDDPVPVTERYPEVPESDESEWQRLVVEHLQLADWITVTVTDEADLLGPTARNGLLRRGLIWPPALQIKPVLLGSLSAGTLLTGEGGDEVFGRRRISPWRHLSRRTSTSRRVALAATVQSALPRPLRRRSALRELRSDELQPWMRPDALERHLRLLAQDATSEPLRWDRALLWLDRRRVAAMAARNFRLVGEEFDVTVSEPLLHPRFLAAVGRAGGALGFGGRRRAMEVLFGDVLPAAAVERGDKALFNRAFLGESTREFARTWDGTGVDHALVDTERLRDEWLAERPSAISSVLLQAAWLHTAGGGS